MKKTIGQKICVAVISELLGISEQQAWLRHVRGKKISPSWEIIGLELLKPPSKRKFPDAEPMEFEDDAEPLEFAN